MKLVAYNQLDHHPRRNEEERIVQAIEVRQRANVRAFRVCTVFGYRHGGYTAMLAWIGLALLMPSICLGGCVLFATQDVMRAVQFDIWFWGAPVSLIVTTALLFIFLKLRHAFSVVWVSLTLFTLLIILITLIEIAHTFWGS